MEHVLFVIFFLLLIRLIGGNAVVIDRCEGKSCMEISRFRLQRLFVRIAGFVAVVVMTVDRPTVALILARIACRFDPIVAVVWTSD